VAVIGLGCIGGSVARALRAQGVEVCAWSASPMDNAHAAAAGVRIAEHDGAAAACADASHVVLAVPVREVAAVAREAVAAASGEARIFHVAGLQRAEALGLDHATAARVLGTHPMAGSHDTGFSASRPDLFVGCAVSVEARADPRARRAAEWLWRTVGAQDIDYRSAEAHDRLMTWVSQLPQLTATALGAALAEADIPAALLGTGGRDVTRLAASPLGSWPELLAGAPRELDAALAALERTLGEIRTALAAPDAARLEAIWERARAWRARAARPSEPEGRTT
jgi:prephenate dehydrogenase